MYTYFSQVHSKIVSKTNLISTSNHEKGVFYRIRIPHFIFDSLNIHKYILAPNDPIFDEIMIESEVK